MQFLTSSAKDTRNLGQGYGKKCVGGEIFLFSGDLGAGKTEFVKGLAEGLGITEDITSPTFNYEKIYQGRDNLTLYHFDLYRENKIDEDIRLLLEEAFSDLCGVTAVEWSERGEGYWPSKATKVKMEWLTESERRLEIK